jgi:dihydrolipoamide dehydrogenase
MSQGLEILLPDIGNFQDVSVVEVLVKPGDTLTQGQSLISLESDKATMEIPAPQAGVVAEVKVAVGDKISRGSLLLLLHPAAVPAAPSTPGVAVVASSPQPNIGTMQAAEVVVIGGGPGGYTAAFRAADLGKQVTLIERDPQLGGVCLNVGCIPSKALLHAAQIINEAAAFAAHGVQFGKPAVDLAALRTWQQQVVRRLTGGLTSLAKQRKVTVLRGEAQFTGTHTLTVTTAEGSQALRFHHAIIAAGSQPVRLPFLPDDPRVMDSTGALALADMPARLLIIGGGIIGLEMATVYAALGAQVTIVELQDQLIPGADADLVRVLHKRLQPRCAAIYLQAKVTRIDAGVAALTVYFEGGKAPASAEFDRVLVAVGRRPNGKTLGLDTAGVAVTDAGFIPVNNLQQTNLSHILAVGDITGNPMLAHKASHEAKVAAEVIAGLPAAFDARAIPSVAYTDPEVAWMGLTELEAKKQGIELEKAVFPWAASGRNLGLGREDGFTKLLFDKQTHRLLGAGIVGINAGELIAEAVLALEMGADAEDLALTIHPHPTLSETLGLAAEIASGCITDLYLPKKP